MRLGGRDCFSASPWPFQCDGSLCGCWDWIRRLLQVKSGKIRDSWGLEYSYLGRDGVGVLLVSDLFGTLRSMDDAIHDRLHVHMYTCTYFLMFSLRQSSLSTTVNIHTTVPAYTSLHFYLGKCQLYR